MLKKTSLLGQTKKQIPKLNQKQKKNLLNFFSNN